MRKKKLTPHFFALKSRQKNMKPACHGGICNADEGCKRSAALSLWLFLFFNLYLFFYSYILIMLSITAAANWKLFAFYGKYVQNRPSKKRSSRTLQVNCVQWDCAFFFLHSLAGCSYLHWVWQALGRASDEVQFWSIRLFYFPISSSVPRYSLKTRLSFGFLC